MKWRTDKPTANVIVALVRYNDDSANGLQITSYDFRVLEKKADDFYIDFHSDREHIPTERITKWADLEEDETVTDCYQYSAVEEELDAFIKSGKAIKEENCGNYTTTYIDPLKVARHFAKWGAEHLIDGNSMTRFTDDSKKVSSDLRISNDLDEAAKEFANKEFPNEPAVGQWGTGDYEPPVDMEYPREIAKDAFKAGAEWVIGQLKEE